MKYSLVQPIVLSLWKCCTTNLYIWDPFLYTPSLIGSINDRKFILTNRQVVLIGLTLWNSQMMYPSDGTWLWIWDIFVKKILLVADGNLWHSDECFLWPVTIWDIKNIHLCFNLYGASEFSILLQSSIMYYYVLSHVLNRSLCHQECKTYCWRWKFKGQS